jgi:hypothetical protein
MGVIASSATGFVGARLGAVTHHYLAPADGCGYSGGGDGVDADIAAVVLDVADRGRRTMTWAMEGGLEEIAVLGDQESCSSRADTIAVASAREAWRDHIGSTITAIGAAWHVSGDACPESVWAIRLDFLSGSVVVALGAVNHAIEYMPDELVVLFDRARAEAYSPRHVTGSAWGKRVEPT